MLVLRTERDGVNRLPESNPSKRHWTDERRAEYWRDLAYEYEDKWQKEKERADRLEAILYPPVVNIEGEE